jgi:quercetin dioxygenase-like cupin family protein
MPVVDFEAERTYEAERFSAQEVFRTDRSKVVCGYFEPGQFIPVHAPESDVVISVRAGTATVREGETDHRVGPGDVVVVEARTARGVRADDDEPLEALLVTAPPPTDAEHEPVRQGIRHDEFEPTGSETDRA